MPFTLVGYHESKTATSLLAINALADQHITHAGIDITVPELNKIMGVAPISATLVQSRLASPSLREIFLEDLPELGIGATIPTDEGAFNDFTKSPIELVQSEKLNAQVLHAGAPENSVVLVWLCDRPPLPIAGDIHTIRCTRATLTSTYAWVNGALTLGQTLPAGRYAVVGARGQSATATYCFRLVFVGGSWRPGALMTTTLAETKTPSFRHGGLGIWGEFEFDQPPSVDLLAPVATGAVVIYLDLIQVRKGR